MQVDESALFQQLIRQRQASTSTAKPANGSLIPKFYFKSKTTDHPLQPFFDRAARDIASERRGGDILSNEDLDKVWALLQECANESNQPAQQSIADSAATLAGNTMIGYDEFRGLASKLPHKFQPFFKPSVFLRLQHNDEGKIDINQLFSYVLRRASLIQERLCISVYDVDGDGYLNEQEVEKYLSDLIPGFPQLQTLEPEFRAFYLCGAVRKFFFFLDQQRKGRIAITAILISPILSEFFELQQPDLAPNLLLSNWFSLYSALKIYNQYVDLDVDRNGMLSVGELSKFAKSRYSEVFIQRVYQECQTYGGEMDYRNYLDFVLAMNEINAPASLAFIFRLLDINGQGYLDEFTISYFVRSLAPLVPVQINMSNLTFELMDMANCGSAGRIRLADLMKCGVGGTVVSIMIDVHALMQNQTKD